MSTTCDTATAFDGYGIPDGVDLVHRTRYRLLADGEPAFEPTPDQLDRVARAFRGAYVQAAAVPIVPEPLELALEDAVAMTADAYADEDDADLREEVLPAFYATIAGYFCAYRETAPDDGVGVWLVDDGPR